MSFEIISQTINLCFLPKYVKDFDKILCRSFVGLCSENPGYCKYKNCKHNQGSSNFFKIISAERWDCITKQMVDKARKCGHGGSYQGKCSNVGLDFAQFQHIRQYTCPHLTIKPLKPYTKISILIIQRRAAIRKTGDQIKGKDN